MTNTVSFPGLSLGPFNLNPVAVPEWFPLQIRWYGIFIVIGMILGFTYAAWRAKQSGIKLDDLIDYVIFALPIGIICARLYYVLFNLSSYKSFLDVIAIWNGGLAIYGGVIGGLLTMFIVAKKKKDNLPLILDCFAPGVMIGQILGRWGNFFNAEAYGTLDKIGFPFIGDIPTPSFEENFPLRMVINGTAVHPTFLYECVWNLLGFVIINLFYKKKKFDGEIVMMYLSWYGFGRFFIEGMREDSLMLGSFRISQLVALVCVIAGIAVIIAGRKKAAEKSLALDDYVSQFSSDDAVSEKSSKDDSSSEAEAAKEENQEKNEKDNK